MKNIVKKIKVQTRKSEEAIDITSRVMEVVKNSKVKEGVVYVMNMHTSAGLIVTEGLPCLEEDVLDQLKKLAPEDGNYHHKRYLDIDGRLGFNADTHLKSVIGGFEVFFPIQKGKIVRGSRQTIYFLEFDGPLMRTYTVHIMGM